MLAREAETLDSALRRGRQADTVTARLNGLQDAIIAALNCLEITATLRAIDPQEGGALAVQWRDHVLDASRQFHRELDVRVRELDA